MVDENVSNYYGIKEVFRLEIVASNIKSCQIHYKWHQQGFGQTWGKFQRSNKNVLRCVLLQM